MGLNYAVPGRERGERHPLLGGARGRGCDLDAVARHARRAERAELPEGVMTGGPRRR